MKNVGILCPISSIKSHYGIGCFNKHAYELIDFCKKGRIKYLSVLPFSHTSYGDSPYQGLSCYAINPYFIDITKLIILNLLTQEEIDSSNLINDTNFIDYGNLFYNFYKIMKIAYSRATFDYKDFINANPWVKDYSLFMALKETFNNKPWYEWEDTYKFKNEDTINKFIKDNSYLINFYIFLQYLVYNQYNDFKKYANDNGVLIIGDIPIYVAYDSVEVWSEPKMFLLDSQYVPTLVAGVPPDYFSNTGQLWGNPLYNYENMKKDNYFWFKRRIMHNLNLFDLIRIDHFRAFSAYYCIPSKENDAINGFWQDGPKIDLFNAISENHLPIIAENLGLLDDEVANLLKETGYPGMRVLQFELNNENNIKSLKEIDSNNVIYTGTHDNDTFIGYYKTLSESEKEILKKEINCHSDDDLIDKLIEYTYSLEVDTIIIPLHDLLKLDEKARLNTPGTSNGNWTFMFNNFTLSDKLSLKLKALSDKYQK